ncbi:hypothetical protein E0E07_17750 [Bacillus velezensis]|nr:RHS repeat-associated core domain-containing protein [Bacillus velezensis]QBK24140.1 hypothetical protein E0E07_17750 [Bacillus velezensis]
MKIGIKDNRYRYAGYQYDEETGLYYLMARYYEPRHPLIIVQMLAT